MLPDNGYVIMILVQKNILKVFIISLVLFFIYYYLGYVIVSFCFLLVIFSFVKPTQVEKEIGNIKGKLKSIKEKIL